MSDENPAIPMPINTGLAERVRQKAEAEKARLRAVMPSTAATIVEAGEVKIKALQTLNEVPNEVPNPNFAPPGIPGQKNTGLAQRNAQRIEEEKKRLKALMPSAELEEETSTPLPSHSEQEHEPKGFNWAPVTPGEIASKYPKESAISDLKMVLNAAVQQPEMAVALIGKQGTSFLVKTDKAGQFYMCEPNSSSKEFNNPARNTDMDNDEDDVTTKEQMTPDYRRAQFGNNTKTGPKDSPDPLRYYEDVEKEFGKLIDFDIENKKAIKETTVNEGKQKTIKATELNTMLYAVQKELRENESPDLEKFANSLSEEIVQNIISGVKTYNYDKYCGLVKAFTKLTEG